MPREKIVAPQSNPNSSASHRVRRIPVVIVDHDDAPLSSHVVDLKPRTASVLHAVEPIRSQINPAPPTIIPIAQPGGFRPNLQAFRERAQALTEQSIDTPYQITKKPLPELLPTRDRVIPASTFTRQNFLKEEKRVESTQSWYRKFTQDLRGFGNIRKPLTVGFTSLALLFTMPIYALTTYPELTEVRDTITSRGGEAVSALRASKDALATGNTALGGSLLVSALTSFEQAQASLDSVDTMSKTLLSMVPYVGTKVSSGEALLTAGEDLTLVASQLLYAQNQAPTSSPLTTRLTYWSDALTRVYPRIVSADEALKSVDLDAVPAEMRDTVTTLTAAVTATRNDVALLRKNMPTVLDALGAQSLRRYLVVLQNSAELRATGGFIGSYALVDIDQGEIKRMEIAKGGSYDLQGQLSVHQEPPQPLSLVNSRWEFQDANWYPDFPSSARNLMWFYERSGGPTVDGVIAVNDQVISDLLTATGPVTMSGGLQITAASFRDALQTHIAQARATGSKTPKSVLAELGPILLDRLAHSSITAKATAASAVSAGLTRGDILIYSADTNTQDTIQTLGWDGALRTTTGDYLHVNISNIGGQKSDADLTGRIEHQAWIQPDGSIINTVNFIRTHDGTTSDASSISYVRMYVPKGSTLVEASGFTFPAESQFHKPLSYANKNEQLTATEQAETFDAASGTRVTEEFGKTVFGNWVVTKPRETSVARITYRLPFSAFSVQKTQNALVRAAHAATLYDPAFRYSVFLERQPGLRNFVVRSHVIVPPAWRSIWHSGNPGSTRQLENGVMTEFQFEQDTFFGMTAVQN